MRKTLISLTGPAFVAAVAYVDPGNVAANISAGSHYGYLLVWVLVVANLMAMFIQYHSAKLGLVTHRSLPEIMGERLSRRARLGMWAQAELIAAATDLAEVIGGAIALQLLFNLPLFAGALIIGAVSIILLIFQKKNQWFEGLVIGLLLVICIGFLAGLAIAPPDPADVAGGLIPRLEGKDSILLAASMLGATVMPHAIYLHSSLTKQRYPDLEIPHVLAGTRADIAVALSIAGLVNVGLLVLAGSAPYGVDGTETISGAHTAIASHLGPLAGVLFAIGLLASGLASTSVGAYAGSEIMDGLLHIKVPLLVRRLVTLIPALVIIGCGVDPTMALVVSQALLSLGIPFAIIPLFRYAGSRDVMGEFAAKPWSMAVGWTLAALVIALNLALVLLPLL